MELVFSPITARAKYVIIVACGPSAERLNPVRLFEASNAGVHIIAVNAAVTWLSVCHSWFSNDPSDKIRYLMRNQRPGVKYYAAVPDDYGKPDAVISTHRAPAEANVHYLHRAGGTGLNNDPIRVVSCSSAYGALGLAWHMQATDVVLIGVDGNTNGYAYVEGRPVGNFNHLPMMFASVIGQITKRGMKIINGSPDSSVSCFTKMDPNAAVNWIIGRTSGLDNTIQPETKVSPVPTRNQHLLGRAHKKQKQQLHGQKLTDVQRTDSRERRLRTSRRRRSVAFLFS